MKPTIRRGSMTRRSTSLLSVAAATGMLVVGATVVGPSLPASASTRTASLSHIGGSLTVWSEWTSVEQQYFEAAYAPFSAETGIKINYEGKSSNIAAAVEAAAAGGKAPDVAFVPSPAALTALAAKGSIVPLTSSVIGSEASDYAPVWNQLASYNGKLYGIWFKAANKNTIWYNPAEFAVAGIKTTPKTWQQLIGDAATLKAAGVTPLKTAGPADYDLLAAHKLSWQDPSVTTAFDTLAPLVAPANLLGGTSGALGSGGDYPSCADQVFPKAGAMPKAAMVIEADFVVSEITGNEPNATAGTKAAGGKACTTDPSKSPCYDFFPFPAPAADAKNSSALQGAGDVAMLFHASPQAKAFMKYIASPEPAEIWAHLGGYASPNKLVPLSSYPDPVTQADASELAHATGFVFSLDDLQTGWEPDLWADMLNFVKNPSSSNITSVEATMQKQATAAMGG
jgi:alpha-glucoside transport system substrate-binding protein